MTLWGRKRRRRRTGRYWKVQWSFWVLAFGRKNHENHWKSAHLSLGEGHQVEVPLHLMKPGGSTASIGSWPTYRSYNCFMFFPPQKKNWTWGILGILGDVPSHFWNTPQRPQPFVKVWLHFVATMLASLGALDGLGDMRSIINTSKYFKVLQSTSTILWNGQYGQWVAACCPCDSYFKSRRNRTQRTGSCCVSKWWSPVNPGMISFNPNKSH